MNDPLPIIDEMIAFYRERAGMAADSESADWIREHYSGSICALLDLRRKITGEPYRPVHVQTRRLPGESDAELLKRVEGLRDEARA